MYGKCLLEANKLKLVKLEESKAEPIDSIDQSRLDDLLCKQFTHKAYVALWLDYKVLIGLWQDEKFRFYKDEPFELKYVQRLRAFNEQRELHVWRTNGKWKGRFRSDIAGEPAEAVEAHQLLFGTKGERLSPEFASIEEDRGTKLILPLQNLRFDKDGNPNTRVFIRTYNYVRPNTVHQASYVDCRFVAFADENQQELT